MTNQSSIGFKTSPQMPGCIDDRSDIVVLFVMSHFLGMTKGKIYTVIFIVWLNNMWPE